MYSDAAARVVCRVMPLNLFDQPISSKGVVIGCTTCPQNKIPHVRKVINLERVTGKKLFVWAQNPGAKENEKGLELVGPTGQFLWDGLKTVGISRDQCDVQNVLRCWN